MTFGIRIATDSGEAVIDSGFLNYTLVYTGSFTAITHQTVVIEFPSPITTTAIPVIAIQKWQNGGFALRHVRMNGSPGNWTGFSVRAYRWANWFPSQPANMLMNYRIYAAGMPIQESFGMGVWDAASVPVYDSSKKPLVFSGWMQTTDGWSDQDGGWVDPPGGWVSYMAAYQAGQNWWVEGLRSTVQVSSTHFIAMSFFEPIHFYRVKSSSSQYSYFDMFAEAGMYFDANGYMCLIIDSENITTNAPLRSRPNIPQVAIIPP